jgi:hypothetical protein
MEGNMESDDLDVKFEAWFKEQQNKGNIPITMSRGAAMQTKKIARLSFIWAWHHGFEEGWTDATEAMKKIL